MLLRLHKHLKVSASLVVCTAINFTWAFDKRGAEARAIGHHMWQIKERQRRQSALCASACASACACVCYLVKIVHFMRNARNQR